MWSYNSLGRGYSGVVERPFFLSGRDSDYLFFFELVKNLVTGYQAAGPGGVRGGWPPRGACEQACTRFFSDYILVLLYSVLVISLVLLWFNR